MNDYIKKQTSVNFLEDLEERELTAEEILERQTPVYMFYKGYIDGVTDFENNNSLSFDSFTSKNEHYLAGYEDAQNFNKRLAERKLKLNRKRG